MELVSVIIPVYKVEPYLDRCVQSVVNQSYPNLEIILVDDGSPDQCPAMCDAWAKKDPRIRVIHKKNGGLSDARNAGMAAATGEYISFVDSDDWIAPEMLERLVKALERDDSDIAACAVEMVWEDGRENKTLTVRKNLVLEREDAQRALLNETLLKQPACFKLYRSETIRDILFAVGKYHEDVFWSYQAVGRARRVSLIDYVGYYYFQHAGSIMGEGYSLKRLDAIEAVVNRYHYFEKEFPALAKDAKVSILNNCIYHGQMALKYCKKEDRKTVFSTLNKVRDSVSISNEDCAGMKASHRLWLKMAMVSLPLVCQVKNCLGRGL